MQFDVFSTKFAQDIYLQKYSMDGLEKWADTARRVVDSVCGQYLNSETQEKIYNLIKERKFIPGGRYLYSAGRSFHQVNNCFLFRAEDSRESWAETMHSITSSLMTGGGIGVDYSNLRGEGALIKRTGGVSTGPLALMHMVNEAGRYIMQGGARRSAIWSGLSWKHPDIKKYMQIKNWSPELRKIKEGDFNFPLPMELTNISVIYDTEFFKAVFDSKHEDYALAREVWNMNCEQAFKTAEPGMSMNFLKDSESLRNACAEVTSSDDSDKCNLGTMWLNNFNDKEEFAEACYLATQFLLCGGIYSDTPTNKIKEVGEKNNRIGLGLGGIHEWLITRGYKYEVVPELHKWLRLYEQESDSAAYICSKELGVAVPIGKRACAPNGTIGLLAETTTSVEPLFSLAWLKRYLGEDNKWKEQYIVDGVVKRLIDKGVSLDNVQDAYTIPFRDRVKFQADIQNYVDMSISSTCNLAPWGSEHNNADTLAENSKVLLRYAKRLRGFTCYPDGARGGQPLTRVDLDEALANEGVVYEENERECLNGVCGV